MAIFHLHTKIIKRSAGRTATAAAAYRSASKIFCERLGVSHDYSNKSEVDECFILSPANSPEWVSDRSKLWNAVERKENRKDAQVAREIEVSIPVELTNEDKVSLVKKYAEQQFVSRGMVADIAFHKLNSENPHAHILLTLREIGESGFLTKNRKWNDKKLLDDWRSSWAESANVYLKRGGKDCRIDHRTLKEQGVDRVASNHYGPTANAMIGQGKIPDRALPSLLEKLKQELRQVQAIIRQLLSGKTTAGTTEPIQSSNNKLRL